MTNSFSLYKISDENSFDFCPAEYSRFKFGDDLLSEKFGSALAQKFIETYLSKHPIENQIVVISSPYSFIPTATFSLKKYFVYTLNRWLAQNGKSVVQTTKIHRTISYKEDYGELDAPARMQLIGQDSFHIDKTFLNNKTLLFIDDIKITGTHEKVIQRMIEQFDLKNEVHFLYFSELVSKDIHPKVENQLNYFAVKSIFDLEKIINSDRFEINTRLVKYLLISDNQQFKTFISKQKRDFKTLLFDMAIGNNYHTIKEYQKNLSFLHQQIL